MRVMKVLALALGVCLLFWIVRKLGIQELKMGFQTLGWRLLVPVAIIFPCYLLYTYSWDFFLKRFEHHIVPFWTLFRIKMAGEAANTLTPLNFAGGDPVRIWLLSKKIPVAIGGASVVVDRTLQIMAIVMVIFLGNLVAAFKMDLPIAARWILAGSAAFLLGLVCFFFYYQTRGLFRKLAHLANRFKIKRINEEMVRKIEDVDQHILEFYRQDRLVFFFCFFLQFTAKILGVVEIYVLARFLGVPMGPLEALFFAAVIPITNMIGGIVPGNLGVLEGVVSSLFYALHWNPADGVIIQIARRIRAFIWILVGLLFLSIFKHEDKKALEITEKTPA